MELYDGWPFPPNPPNRRAKQVRSLIELEDAYVRRLLRKQDIPPLPDLVEIKRLQLQLLRKVRNGSTRLPAQSHPV